MAACSLGAPASPTDLPPTETALPATEVPATSVPTAAPTETPVPPTEVPPTPTDLPATDPPALLAFSVDTARKMTVFSSFGEGNIPRSLAFSPDNRVIVSAGGNTEDFDIRIWDVTTGSLLNVLKGHTGIVWQVTFSPDGRLLVSGSGDGTARIWDMETGEQIKTLEFPGEVSSLAFSPDGQTLAVGGTDGFPNAAIWTFSVSDWQQQLKLLEFWNIPSILFSPDGTRIAGGGTSRNARIWQASNGAEEAVLYHSHQVATLVLSPDGRTIAAGLCTSPADAGQCSQSSIWLWDMETGDKLGEYVSVPDQIVSMAYSIDGSLLIVGARNGGLRFHTTTDFKVVVDTGYPGSNGVITLSRDGRYLATTGNDGLIKVWQIGP